MHGIVFSELKKYVVTSQGPDTWDRLLQESGLSTASYLTTSTYPDAEAVTLISTASKMLKVAPSLIMEGFGEFIVPSLIKIYKGLIRPEWKTLDLLENVENVIHTAVRLRNPDMTPPKLTATRPTPGSVVITYASGRKMCGVAKGIAKGIAKHYGERIEITETTCMLKGNRVCTLVFKAA